MYLHHPVSSLPRRNGSLKVLHDLGSIQRCYQNRPSREDRRLLHDILYSQPEEAGAHIKEGQTEVEEVFLLRLLELLVGMMYDERSSVVRDTAVEEGLAVEVEGIPRLVVEKVADQEEGSIGHGLSELGEAKRAGEGNVSGLHFIELA